MNNDNKVWEIYDIEWSEEDYARVKKKVTKLLFKEMKVGSLRDNIIKIILSEIYNYINQVKE